jgi:hypothetical protein
VHGEICPSCCGTGRENTIDCPLECEYLLEARKHEHPVPIGDGDFPNSDIRLTEDFVARQEHLVMWLSLALALAIDTHKAVDSDAREGLEALIRTYRTRESGLIYETRPQNPYAAEIQEALKLSIEELGKRMQEKSGMYQLRDADVMGVLVFLQRLALQHNNGRPRGRSFLHFLRSMFPAKPQESVVA